MTEQARRARGWIYAGAPALLAVITWIDYATGYELSLFVFYLAPVALVAWYGSRRAGVAIALAAGACWYLADRLAMHTYSSPILVYWETFTRIAALVVAALTLSAIHADLRRREELLDLISHDLRAPLGALVGQAQLLGKMRRGDDFSSARVDAILRCASRMNGMIEDLLDSARRESGQLRLQPEAVDVGPWLSELVGRCAPLLEDGRVHLAAPREERLVVRADPARLERIVLNLLLNALKFSPPESAVELGVSGEGGRVAIRVTDRGDGIPEAELERVFERFYRGQRASSRAGLGLGLYSVRLLVEAHGGAVRAEPVRTGGTSFVVTLPAAAPAARPATEASPSV
ncbi:MAG TPA: HAMP domain-containing sensor histidine kinase [Anaeromyxobacteraceae bacterium]|nr:HAMP domain-containing sensor histidine kinase [Anaeromyxobacteraceae bacterium]